MQQTSAPGVFAASDAATSFTHATRGAAAGVMTGVAAQRSLFKGIAAGQHPDGTRVVSSHA